MRALLSRLMEIQIWHPPVPAGWLGVCVWWAQQSSNGTFQYFSPGESSSSSPLPDASQFRFSLYVPGVFELMFLHWSLWYVFMKEWVCAQTLSEDAWVHSTPPLHLDWVSADFHSQLLWGLLFLALVLQTRQPDVWLGDLLLRRYSWFLSATCGCGTSPFWVSAPFVSLNVASSLYP